LKLAGSNNFRGLWMVAPTVCVKDKYFNSSTCGINYHKFLPGQETHNVSLHLQY